MAITFPSTLQDADAALQRLCEQATLFHALGHPARLQITRLLACYGDQITVTQLVARLDESGYPLTQPTVSHHLRFLLECGAIARRSADHYSYYTLKPQVLQRLRTALGDLLEQETRRRL